MVGELRSCAAGVGQGGIIGRQEIFEASFVDGLHVSLLWGNNALLEFLPDGVIHELHAQGFAAHDDICEFLGGAFADDGADGRGGKENLIDRNASRLVATLHEQLGNDPAQGTGEHGTRLSLLLSGEDVDDTVDRFARVVGVERAKDEQTGFGGSESQRDGFQVAHFTHEHDIRILAQGGAQAVGKRSAITRHFALGNDAFFGGVDELDRFLDGDDMAREIGVDVVDDGGKCRRFAGAGGAGDKHETGAHFTEALDLLGHIEFLEGEDFGRNDTEHAAVSTLLFHVVATEAGTAVHLVSEVGITAFHVTFPKLGIANGLHELHHVVMGEDMLGNGFDITVDTNLRGLTFGEVKIGAAELHKFLEIGMNDGIHERDGGEKN